MSEQEVSERGSMLRAFLDAIWAEPQEICHQGAFADWLDEHGEPKEAQRYRLNIQLTDLVRRMRQEYLAIVIAVKMSDKALISAHRATRDRLSRRHVEIRREQFALEGVWLGATPNEANPSWRHTA